MLWSINSSWAYNSLYSPTFHHLVRHFFILREPIQFWSKKKREPIQLFFLILFTIKPWILYVSMYQKTTFFLYINKTLFNFGGSIIPFLSLQQVPSPWVTLNHLGPCHYTTWSLRCKFSKCPIFILLFLCHFHFQSTTTFSVSVTRSSQAAHTSDHRKSLKNLDSSRYRTDHPYLQAPRCERTTLSRQIT